MPSPVAPQHPTARPDAKRAAERRRALLIVPGLAFARGWDALVLNAGRRRAHRRRRPMRLIDLSHPIVPFGDNAYAHENLANLDQLPRSRFTFIGLPLPLVGGSGSPIRAAALVSE